MLPRPCLSYPVAATDVQGLGATFTWTPSLASSGIYRVYGRWISNSSHAPDAPYTIHHAAGSTLVRMDQRYDGGRWNLLGEFTLQPGQNHRVVVSDDAQAWVFADAVRFVRVGSARIVQADAVKIVPNTAENALYVHTDHLGTPRKMTDDSRAVVWDAEYRPFGEADSITGTAANDNRFPGQMFDAESGLHYNYYRDYDPTLGRYIQSDPTGENPLLFAILGGAAVGAFVDLGFQLYDSGGRLSCLDFGRIGEAAAAGALLGGAGGLARSVIVRALGRGGAAAVGDAAAGAGSRTAQKLSKVKKEIREEIIGGGKFTKKTKVTPGKGPGQSRSEMEFVKNSEGKLIRSRKFSFDRGNKFQHKKPVRGGPEGRPANEN